MRFETCTGISLLDVLSVPRLDKMDPLDFSYSPILSSGAVSGGLQYYREFDVILAADGYGRQFYNATQLELDFVQVRWGGGDTPIEFRAFKWACETGSMLPFFKYLFACSSVSPRDSRTPTSTPP